MTVANDEKVIRAIRNDDRQVVSALYVQYRKPFFVWAQKYFHCQEADAADAFQEAVIVFYQNVQEQKIAALQSSIKTYLFGIGKNVIRKQLKKQQKTQLKEELPIDFEQVDYVAEMYQLTHRQTLIQQALQQIGENCRQLLTYFYYQEFDMESIALRMEYKNTDTVKSRKRNCMVKLAKVLKDNFNELL